MITLPKSLEVEQNVLGGALFHQDDALLMIEKTRIKRCIKRTNSY